MRTLLKYLPLQTPSGCVHFAPSWGRVRRVCEVLSHVVIVA